jgi:hypothetical protein
LCTDRAFEPIGLGDDQGRAADGSSESTADAAADAFANSPADGCAHASASRDRAASDAASTPDEFRDFDSANRGAPDARADRADRAAPSDEATVAERRSQKVTIARPWVVWATANLLRAAAREEIVRALIDQGAPIVEVDALVASIESSPIFEAARDVAALGRRAMMVTELQRAVAQQASARWRVERLPFPGVELFYQRHVAANLPVIFTDLATHWPAFSRWSPDDFAQRFGDVEVSVTLGRESDPAYDMHHAKLASRMSLRELVARIAAVGESNDLYMVAQDENLRGALGALLDEIALPDGLLAMDRVMGGSALWFGPAGTVTPLHHDTSTILFCQVYGRKRFVLIPPWELDVCDGATAMYAGVDPERPDRARFPWFDDVWVESVTLEPGDALLLPVGWWHHVRALDTSISVALNNLLIPNRFDDYLPAQA